MTDQQRRAMAEIDRITDRSHVPTQAEIDAYPRLLQLAIYGEDTSELESRIIREER